MDQVIAALQIAIPDIGIFIERGFFDDLVGWQQISADIDDAHGKQGIASRNMVNVADWVCCNVKY